MPKRDRSAADQARQVIAQRILDLDLPPGARLDELALANDLGLSRTPVREALFRLSADSLIKIGAQGGFQVADIDLIDVRSLFEAYGLLARAVARLLVERASDSEIDELEALAEGVRRAVRAKDPKAITHANTKLHLREAEIAANAYLLSLANRIHLQAQRLAYLAFGGAGMLTSDLASHYGRASDDHSASIDALRRRDADAAEKIAADHVLLFRNRTVRLLQGDSLAAVQVRPGT